MKGKSALMTGVAAAALVLSAQAGLAGKSASDNTSGSSAATMASGPSNAELAARVQTLEDELQADETKVDADHTRLSTLEQNFNYTTWTFDNARPVVNSGDGRFSMAFRVRFQFDNANFMQDSATTLATNAPQAVRDLSSGAVIRRGFFGVEGKAFKDFWYEFRLNGGGSDGGSQGASGVPTAGEGDPLLSLARVAYLGIPNFMINLGVIEPALMFEGTTSSGQLMFMERPEIDNIAADSFGAADSRRGIEVRYQKDSVLMPGDNLVLNVALTGNKTGSAAGHGSGGDEQAQLLDRVSYRFWSDGPSNASIGFSNSSILYSGNTAGGGSQTIRLRDRPEIRVDGTRLIDTGGIAAKTGNMYAFDGGVNIDNFFLGGEWAQFQVDRLASAKLAPDSPTFSGWYLEGSWVITGEPKTYTVSATNNEVGGFGAPRVASPFSFAGDSWGAWELAARYSDTNLNWKSTTAATATAQAGINGGDERVITIGLNWYLNNNVKLQFNDLITNVSKFSAVSHVLANKGSQDFNTVGVRLQFTN
jgi:phosphate-selective porin OprO/OprP